MSEHIQQTLQQYYQSRFPEWEAVVIGDVENISAGWESELFAFTLTRGAASDRAEDELVARIYSGEGTKEKALHEFDAMTRLYEAGYAVPRVHLLELEQSPWARPFLIMDRIHGQHMWSHLDAAADDEADVLITQFCQLFARLHQVDWRLFVDEGEQVKMLQPFTFIDDWLARGDEAHLAFPHSGLMPTIDWLRARREAFVCARPAPTHNDFHPANVLLPPDGPPIVIDWPAFQVSDARFDLAWTLMLIQSYMGPSWRDRILHHYSRFAAQPVAALELFEVFACARRLFDLSITMGLGADGVGLRSEAVAAMRRSQHAFERVYEMMVMRTAVPVPRVEALIASLG